MRPDEKSRVPVAGITDQSENRGLPRGARNAGGMTDKPIIFSGPMVRALLEGRKTQTRRVLKPQPPSWAYQDKSPGYSFMTPPGHIDFRGRYVDPDGVDRGPGAKFVKLPYDPGERLWVREAWNAFDFSQDGDDAWPTKTIPTQAEISEIEEAGYRVSPPQIVFRESERARKWFQDQKWRPSIHMPRWASRLTLVVTDVRVQRVQEISIDDCFSEGIEPDLECCNRPFHFEEGRDPECCGNPDLVSDPRADFETLWDSINAKRGFGWDANPWVVALTFTVHRCNIGQMEDAQ